MLSVVELKCYLIQLERNKSETDKEINDVLFELEKR